LAVPVAEAEAVAVAVVVAWCGGGVAWPSMAAVTWRGGGGVAWRGVAVAVAVEVAVAVAVEVAVAWRGVAWRGVGGVAVAVAWRGMAWRGVAWRGVTQSRRRSRTAFVYGGVRNKPLPPRHDHHHATDLATKHCSRALAYFITTKTNIVQSHTNCFPSLCKCGQTSNKYKSVTTKTQ